LTVLPRAPDLAEPALALRIAVLRPGSIEFLHRFDEQHHRGIQNRASFMCWAKAGPTVATPKPTRTVGLGHEDQFRLSNLSGRPP
jgi:hypothetical protein